MSLDFKPLGIEHIGLLKPYFNGCRCRICDCTVGGTFMWRDYFGTQYAIENGVLYLRVNNFNGGTAFSAPFGADCSGAYDRILEHCRENGMNPEFCMVPESRLDEVTTVFPDAEVFSDRAWSDYLYEASDMREMAGRRYSGQRNHINRFLREFPEWSFEKVDSENLAETRDFFANFITNHTKDSVTLGEGDQKTLEILDNFDTYDLLAGVLRADGRIIGFSLGERVCDTLFVHTEKADRDFPGAYQMLVREFARAFGAEVKYINREEDDGDEGLRTSKLSYHPVCLLDKYTVRVKF